MINGGNNLDTVDYSAATGSGVTVDLGNGAAQLISATEGTDTITGVEVAIGSGFGDTLTGTSTANTIDGGAGADTIDGAAGNDTLIGGTGADTITGGTGIDNLTGDAGADVFSFASAADGVSVISDGTVNINVGLHDLITDYTPGTDVIDLGAAFGLGGTLVNNTNFFVIGALFDGTNTSVAAGTPYVVVDSAGAIYHDADDTVAGYTIITETGGAGPSIGDFTVA